MNNAAQHTLDWYRCRLGCITGSNVGLIMSSGKTKDKFFSDKAQDYLYDLVFERTLNPNIVENDELFELYLNQVNASSKAMQWGTEQEANARELYYKTTGRKMVEVGSCKHPTMPFFASSPDGYYYNEDTGEKLCLEVKCLGRREYIKYLDFVLDADALKKHNPQYYYQCHAHMMVTGASATDFVIYNPFQTIPINIVRIPKDDKIAGLIAYRVEKGNEFINDKVSKQTRLRTA